MDFGGNNNLLTASKFLTKIYYIPTQNEWYKAAYYDPTLNSNTGGYWLSAAKNTVAPSSVTADASIGTGSAGNVGNFANFANTANWNNATAGQGNVTTVGTNGGPSYYGTYDQMGNVWEWIDVVINATNRGSYGGGYSDTSSTLLATASAVSRTPTTRLNTGGFRVATLYNKLGLVNFVNVKNANNLAHTTGFGNVNYEYKISQFLITNSQYVEFLNAVAATDLYGLYSTTMGTDSVRGGIVRNGSSGSYFYAAKTNMGDKPVNYVRWFDCARYCNWLTNGKPTGPQSLQTTEDGAYLLNGVTSGIIPRKT